MFRAIYDAVEMLKSVSKGALDKLGNKQYIRSISAYSGNSIFYFPLVVSSSCLPEEVEMIAKSQERQYGAFVAACLSLIPFHKIPEGSMGSIEEYLRIFHQNIGIGSPLSSGEINNFFNETSSDVDITNEDFSKAERYMEKIWKESLIKNESVVDRTIAHLKPINEMGFKLPDEDIFKRVLRKQAEANLKRMNESAEIINEAKNKKWKNNKWDHLDEYDDDDNDDYLYADFIRNLKSDKEPKWAKEDKNYDYKKHKDSNKKDKYEKSKQEKVEDKEEDLSNKAEESARKAEREEQILKDALNFTSSKKDKEKDNKSNSSSSSSKSKSVNKHEMGVGSNSSGFAKELFTNMDLKKANESMPTFINPSVTFIIGDSNETVERRVLIGIKCYVHSYPAEVLIEDLYQSVTANRGFLKFIKWITGEERSLSDLLFGIDKVKYDVAGKGSTLNKGLLDMIKRRSRWSKMSLPYITKTYTPNVSFCITKNDVNVLKNQYGLDIFKNNSVATIMKDNFLLGFIVLDQEESVALIAYEGHNYGFQEVGYNTLEREESEANKVMKRLYKEGLIRR